MNAFSNIKNKLIIETDKKAAETKIESPLINTLKSVKWVNPLPGSSAVYNKKVLFNIPKQFDNLAQCYVKVDITPSGTCEALSPWAVIQLLKIVNLQTSKKVSLMECRTEYNLLRTEECSEKPELWSKMREGIEISSTFSSVITKYIPMYLFFSDDITSFFETRQKEQIQLELITNDNHTLMGFDSGISSLTFQLACLYFDTHDSGRNCDFPYNDLKITRPIVGSYNVFYEEPVLVPRLSTSAKILLRCPNPFFAIHVHLLKNDDLSRYAINTMRLTQRGSEVFYIHTDINYCFFAEEHGEQANGALSYWESKKQKRNVDSGLNILNGDSYPSYLEITFDEISGILSDDYTMYVYHEYRTDFQVSSDGVINQSTDEELYENNIATQQNPLVQLHSF